MNSISPNEARKKNDSRGNTENPDRSISYFTSMLDYIPDAMITTDNDFVVTGWNAAAERIYGWKAEEVIGKPLTDIIQTNYQDTDPDEAARSVRDSGTWSGEVTQLRRDGTRLPIWSSVSVFKDQDGRPVGFIGINRDIIERVRAEDALRLSEEKFAKAFHSSPDIIVLTSLTEGRIVEVNESLHRATGYTHDEIIGKSTSEVPFWANPADRERYTELLHRDGKVRDLEVGFRIKSGEIRDTLLSGEIIQLQDGKYILGVIRDITQRKRAEEELQRNEQLLRLFVEHSPAAIAMFDRNMKYIVASRRYLADYDLGEQNIIGRSHYEVFPEIPERWKEIHRRCLTGVIEKAEEDPFPRLDGRIDWVRWEIHPWYETNKDIGGIILFSEVTTERKQVREALEKRYRELNAIYEASQHLQKLLPPELLAQEVIGVLENTMDYTYGAVLLVDEATGLLEPFAVSDQNRGMDFAAMDKEYIRSKGVRVGVGVTGWVAEHGESLRLGDVRHDPRYLSIRDDIRSELCVPLWIQSQVIGVVNVETLQLDAYSEDDQHLLETVAAQIAIAIQNARLLDELRLHRDRLKMLSRQLVQAHETEQRAIGRELHDQFGQMLTAVKLTIEVARQLPADQAAKKLAEAQEIADDLLYRVSRLSLELRPPMLDDLGLIPALLWHINRYQDQSGIDVHFKHSNVEGKRFGTEIETTAYRIVQEALTNIARHAKATSAMLEVRLTSSLAAHAPGVSAGKHPGGAGGQLEILVEDNGQGFEPEVALAKNRGLSGMRERANLVGGTFRVESTIGKGTRKWVKLPIEEEIE